MLTCSKTYADLPFAHRQHRHPGRCSRIHGHNWTLRLTFACHERDAHGFVVDFGELHYLQQWLDDHLDHACVLAADDPATDALTAAAPDAWRIHTAPDASCEALAMHLCEVFSKLLREHEGDRVWLAQVELSEDSTNSVTYRPHDAASPHAT